MVDFSFEEGKDYYLENGKVVYTETYLKKRKKCCGSGCRHCPYWPMATKGNEVLREKDDKNLED